ncbi:UBA/THIF-type NAD/FAD binding protein [Neorhizobium galegae bv. officinalis]|nr:UBA/THIF-type NAD/FAD binding protein [Neorhizobium galegae bv. officinalis]
MNGFIPEPLGPVLEAVVTCPRTALVESWYRDSKGRWCLCFRATLSVEPTAFMPQESEWYLVVEAEAPRPKITLYPSVQGGISCTFPHQAANLPGPPGSSWRLGNPCVERPEASFKRDDSSGEPRELGDRLLWRVERLLDWLDAAACDALLLDGDPLELPSFNVTTTPVLGFSETLEDFADWSPWIGRWGFAATAALKGARDHRQVLRFMSNDGQLVKEGSSVRVEADRPADAIWVMLPHMPVIEPWQSPETWKELSGFFISCGLDLADIFRQAGQDKRKTRVKPTTRLLIGFPLSEKVGLAPNRVHWIAADNLGLSKNDTIRNGFRPSERNRVQWDVGKATSLERIGWIKTSNWSSDQLRTRGGAEEEVASKRVLIIGAGAIGSAVAENLARSGVRDIGVIDNDILEVGNLSRHTLGLSDCGHGKAERLAARLDDVAPDVVSTPFKDNFPPSEPRTVALVRKYDVVIDCTGSDAVLVALSEFDWSGEKRFVSLSIGWGAKEFFCYSASEARFPALDALDRFGKNISYRPDLSTANREGVGCWHPVFPATADDIQLWSAIGVKFARRAILEGARSCKIYRIADDGTVAVVDG